MINLSRIYNINRIITYYHLSRGVKLYRRKYDNSTYLNFGQETISNDFGIFDVFRISAVNNSEEFIAEVFRDFVHGKLSRTKVYSKSKFDNDFEFIRDVEIPDFNINKETLDLIVKSIDLHIEDINNAKLELMKKFGNSQT